MNRFFEKKWEKGVIALLLGLAGLGVVFRFCNIAQNNFFLYDEGLYLNYNLTLLRFIDGHHFTGFQDYWDAFYALIRFALNSGKALWFVLVDSRAFWGLLEVWSFPRIVSALAGSLTLWGVYLFAKRFYNSRWVGLLSVVTLALLPSHIFYSSLAFQEALCTFFFVWGIYFYVFPRKFGWRTFLSAFFFVCVYFTNYRLIIAPALIGFVELYTSLAEREKFNLRKYVWHTLMFFCGVFLIGDINDGSNTRTTFSWMFHQANMAEGKFEIFNLLSYPYYVFRLDSVFAGLLFFGNIYFLRRREWRKALPFLLMAVMMAIFSLPYEKGARYICVGLPFLAVAIGALLYSLFQGRQEARSRWMVVGLTAVLWLSFIPKVWGIVSAYSDYERSVKLIKKNDPRAKVISTQPQVQNLFVPQALDVVSVRKNVEDILTLYAQGYHYLVIDPQAYVSYTESDRRFVPPLLPYMEFVTARIRPLKTFEHFNEAIFERFVFEHNENLRHSLKFLSENNERYRTLRIYPLKP